MILLARCAAGEGEGVSSDSLARVFFFSIFYFRVMVTV